MYDWIAIGAFGEQMDLLQSINHKFLFILHFYCDLQEQISICLRCVEATVQSFVKRNAQWGDRKNRVGQRKNKEIQSFEGPSR